MGGTGHPETTATGGTWNMSPLSTVERNGVQNTCRSACDGDFAATGPTEVTVE